MRFGIRPTRGGRWAMIGFGRRSSDCRGGLLRYFSGAGRTIVKWSLTVSFYRRECKGSPEQHVPLV